MVLPGGKKVLPRLIEDLVRLDHSRFHLPRTPSGDHIFHVATGGTHREITLKYVPLSQQFNPDRRDKLRLEHVLGLVNMHAYQWDCYLGNGNHDQANLFIGLSTDTIYDLVAITGLPLEKIPEELHNRGLSTYVGNPILSRLDPLCHIANPWNQLPLKFRLPVSYKAFKAKRKTIGLDSPKAGELEAWAKESAAVQRGIVGPDALAHLAMPS